MNSPKAKHLKRPKNFMFVYLNFAIVIGIVASLIFRYPELVQEHTRPVWEQLKHFFDRTPGGKPVPPNIYDDVFTWAHEYPTCGSLERQSPINYNLTAGSMEYDFISRTNSVEIDLIFDEMNDWASIPVESSVKKFLGKFDLLFQKSNSVPLGFSYRGYRYSVSHLQVKTPGEHHLDAKYFPLELQLFAQSESDAHDLIALGVLLELNDQDESSLVNDIVGALKTSHQDSINLDLQSMIGLFFGELLSYSGSITSPPCSENVIWIHAMQRLSMTPRQWREVRDFIGFNARPTQPRSCIADTHESCQKSLLHHGKSWRFEGNNGLELWSKQFPTCGSGKQQSPVDLVRTMHVEHVAHHMLVESVKLPNPVGWSAIRDARIRRSPYSVSIDLMASTDENGRTCFDDLSNCMPPYYPVTEIDGHVYVLVNIHYHTPSEHRSNGLYHPIELHLVHKQVETAERMVIAFMIEIQTSDYHDSEHIENVFFRSVSKFIRTNQRETYQDFDLNLLAKHLQNHGLKTYQGSLTMPPCTEGVKWYVVDGTLQITLKQFLNLAIAHNSRPPVSRL